MKRYKSKTRREIKCTGLGGEEVSENEQLFEDVIEWFEKSDRRTKADTQKKTVLYRKREKESSGIKKTMGRFGETRKRKEQDEKTGCFYSRKTWIRLWI